MRLPELGLMYYKARMYDPSIGRFLTPDPAGMVDGPNLYAYVLNDPINNVDPSGLYLVCTASSDGYTGTCMNVPDPEPFPSFFGRNRESSGDVGPGSGGGRQGGEGGGGPGRSSGPGSASAPEKMMEEKKCPSSNVVTNSADFLGSFGQGFGDALTFGYYSKGFAALPFGYGEFYADQRENGGGYTAGLVAGGAVGAARVAYAGAAGLAGAVFPARQAVELRNGLKGAFSGLGSAHPRNYTYEQLLSKYGSDRAVKAAAGRTNNTLNAAGAATAASAGSQYNAGCP